MGTDFQKPDCVKYTAIELC